MKSLHHFVTNIMLSGIVFMLYCLIENPGTLTILYKLGLSIGILIYIIYFGIYEGIKK